MLKKQKNIFKKLNVKEIKIYEKKNVGEIEILKNKLNVGEI